jgi:hypothetical protein
MHSFSLLSLVVLHHLVICTAASLLHVWDRLLTGLLDVSADTSLFIPGFDPQPLSVGDLGTDGQGRTTWEIVPGSLTGTFSEPAFIGTGACSAFPLSTMSHPWASYPGRGPE